MRADAGGDESRSGRGGGGWYSLLAAPWGACVWLLWPMWSAAVERFYGGAVLPLAGYLFFLRWERRPPAKPPRDGMARAAWGGLAMSGALMVGGGGLLLEASPLWTMAGWLAVAGAAVFSAGLLGRAGGWAWVRRALFPLLFSFTALPWPALFAAPVTALLRRGNAIAAAELVSEGGRPAVAHGTVIETAGGWVGVEAACSGLVALQTSIMLALFFGELRRLTWRGRMILGVGAVGLALGVNLVRAAWLVWHASGSAESVATHDAAGLIELGTAVMAVTIWSLWVGKSEPEEPFADGGGPDFFRGWGFAALGVLGLSLAGVLAWFSQPSTPGNAREVRWVPSPEIGHWRARSLGEELSRQLRVDAADFLSWRDVAAGRDWILLHLCWNRDPGLRYAPGMHGPEICLPVAGAQLDADLGVQVVKVDGRSIQLHWLRFKTEEGAFHTFSCIWDTTLGQAVEWESLAAIDLAKDRMARVREHRSRFGLERITVALNQCRDDAEALSLVRAMLPRMLKRRE